MNGDAREMDAIYTWLQQVLAERFGSSFVLQSTGSGLVRLILAGAPGVVEIVSQMNVFTRDGSQLPCAKWENAKSEGWTTTIDGLLPAPGASELPDPLIIETPMGYRIRYDILGLTYWMLSRREEVGREDLDSHGRFPATSSHAFNHEYLDRPIVDEWLHVLAQVIQRTWPALELTPRSFRMRVSHDVDTPSQYGFSSSARTLRMMVSDVLKRHDLSAAFRTFRLCCAGRRKLDRHDPYNTFEWIMDVSDELDLVSAFYFICGRTDSAKDARYELEDPAIRSLLRRIHQRGHEIGLHPSYNTYREPLLLIAEANRLKSVCDEENIEQNAWGGRMHYLRWETPTTLRGSMRAGLAYDNTLSYADVPGFRCGTCIEYPGFDPVANCILDIRVRPLIVMEASVISDQYLGLGLGEQALNKFINLKNACKSVNGSFTILWHNSQLSTPAKRSLYKKVLAA